MTTHSVRAKAAIGYVPQDLAIYPDLSGSREPGLLRPPVRHAGRRPRPAAAEVLEVIGLADRAGEQTKNYSGGMKRRLNIGIALLHEPELLILDEPTVGVDPQSRNAILENVREPVRGRAMAVLYTTHYMEEAEHLCDRVGIIDHGKLIAEGTRRELVGLVGERDRVSLGATGDLAATALSLAVLAGVREASATDDGIDLVVDDARSLPAGDPPASGAAGAAVKTVEVTEPDLEAVFLHLTGRALRD